ncbi:MAG: response regulator, partial [Leptolyngbya sp. SIO3F4]|nr:response regulator [Leptolyngbya sp. SIO3F4]
SIFLPFEQVGEKERKAQGTGLGLAISHQIVELMGGTLEVQSTYGQGSKFWFDLDLDIADDWKSPQRRSSATDTIVGYRGDRKTVLVVDDRWENRAVLKNLLAPLGFDIIEAEHGQLGLELAKTHLPDLIITDLVMPVMSGFEMVQGLRKSDNSKHIPIIASSASVFDFDRQQSYDAGCDDFLPKPIQIDELFDYVQQHLNLVWVNDSTESFENDKGDSTEFSGLLKVPSVEILKKLYHSADGGFILEVKAMAEQLLPEYNHFANKVLAFVDDLDDEAIVDCIEPYLNQDSWGEIK